MNVEFEFSMSLQLIERVLELTNAERTKAGLEPLKLNQQLADAADSHSDSMAEDDFFSHTGADGSNVGDRVQSNGYDYLALGENIAAGQQTAEEVVQGWMESPGHRANILNSDYTEIGIGYEYLENDTGTVNYNHYWTQVFGTPLRQNIESENASVEENTVTSEADLNSDSYSPETDLEANDLNAEENNPTEDLETNSSVTEIIPENNENSESSLDNDESSSEITEDALDSVDGETDNFTTVENDFQDYVTGNSETTNLAGGDNFDLPVDNESTENSEYTNDYPKQLDDLFSNSWLGSWIDNMNSYEEMGLESGGNNNFEQKKEYIMQEYQFEEL